MFSRDILVNEVPLSVINEVARICVFQAIVEVEFQYFLSVFPSTLDKFSYFLTLA